MNELMMRVVGRQSAGSSAPSEKPDCLRNTELE